MNHIIEDNFGVGFKGTNKLKDHGYKLRIISINYEDTV